METGKGTGIQHLLGASLLFFALSRSSPPWASQDPGSFSVGTRDLHAKERNVFEEIVLMTYTSFLPIHKIYLSNVTCITHYCPDMLSLSVRRTFFKVDNLCRGMSSTIGKPHQPHKEKKLPPLLADPATYPLIAIVGTVRIWNTS